MTPKEMAQRIARQEAEIQKFVNRGFGVRAGAIAKRIFQRNFELSGYQNGTLKPWKPAKRLSKPSRRARNQYKTLLSSRNHLFQSFTTEVSPMRVRISNTAEYASVHNFGERAGRGKGFQMPQRQFMGVSIELEREVKEMVEQEIKKIIEL